MIEPQTISRNNVEDVLSLTPVQLGMLFHTLNAAEHELYQEQLCFTLAGEIDGRLLRQALACVIETNEMLRAVFRWQKLEHPVQIILKKADLQWKDHDFSTLEPEARTQALIELKQADRAERIDIASHPVRVTLCKLSARQFEVMLSYHHMVMDGWSLGIVLKEWLDTYRSLRSGHQPDLVPKIPFKQFVKLVQQRDKQAERTYWEAYLQGFEKMNVLSGPKSEKEKSDAVFQCCVLQTELQPRIHAFLTRHRLTLATLLYAAWGVCLQRYCGTDDVVFGTTVSGRSAPIRGMEQMVGMFINTLPLRIRAHSGQSVDDLLQEVATDIQNRMPYDRTSLVDLKAYCGFEGTGDMFDSILVLENYPIERSLQAENEWAYIEKAAMAEQTHYDLTITVIDADRLTFEFRYRSGALAQETVQGMAKHFERIVGILIDNPQMPVHQIGMLDEIEQQRLLEWGRNPRPFSEAISIVDMFEAQAAASPEALAVVYDGRALTYSELNRRANRLAHYLRQQGVRKNQVVGIMAERGLEFMVGILAILKAGGAYLPIDPDYPDERIEYMIQHSKVELLLAGKPSETRTPFTGGAEVVAYDEISVDAQMPDHNLGVAYDPDQLFYVLYTSGSTGNPKGVMIRAHAFVNLIRWFTREFDLNANDRVLLIAPTGFDLAQKNLFGALVSGGQLCLYWPGIFDYNRMSNLIQDSRITIINCAPSAFYPLMDFNQETNFVRLSSLKRVFLGGEPIHNRRIRPWIASGTADVEIINSYGPTECTDVVSYYRCDRRHLLSDQAIPIGKPIDNAELYVLGKDGHLLPAGWPGELCIGGMVLAQGYYHAPQLTAERFVPTPHLPSPRVYKTGDQARWLPDGNLEYIGRIDNQVKIRGYRVELAEIESSLARVEGIIQSVVTVGERADGHRYLCAYYVADREIRKEHCIRTMSRELPHFMIPDTFVSLDQFPLTPNGKIDRRALGEPAEEAASPPIPFADRAEEAELVEIWRRVLGPRPFGVHDHFFDAGGNSLLLIQMHGLLEKKFPGKWEIPDLFSYPTIAKMAAYWRQTESAARIEGLPFPQDYYSVFYSLSDTDVVPLPITGMHKEKLEQVASREAIPLPDILLSVWVYLLHEISGQSIVPVYVCGRSVAEARLLKVELAGLTDFEALFDKVRELQSAQKECKRLSVPKDLTKGKPERIVVGFHDADNRSEAILDRTPIDFMLQVRQERDEIRLGFVYRTDRLKLENVNQVLNAYDKLLTMLIQS
ncbi:non-ribosomal peptide synthetase [Paenibacillus methanolicus]|uniref:Amino acid adenylation domain-containing protein n=1 Tax=Paenibacillus methanolicus TaxID=582686 RepID=A0A5S5CBI6_9BACL|nr:non-ribosomal peptide synthetase [Paenibacillus methanolicus]TYP76741.1 amino acid adenylation domain-containing protein [Paenibacillus methanolicus]